MDIQEQIQVQEMNRGPSGRDTEQLPGADTLQQNETRYRNAAARLEGTHRLRCLAVREFAEARAALAESLAGLWRGTVPLTFDEAEAVLRDSAAFPSQCEDAEQEYLEAIRLYECSDARLRAARNAYQTFLNCSAERQTPGLTIAESWSARRRTG